MTTARRRRPLTVPMLEVFARRCGAVVAMLGALVLASCTSNTDGRPSGGTGTPGSTAPGTPVAGTTAPGTTAPGTIAPGTTAPGTTAPVDPDVAASTSLLTSSDLPTGWRRGSADTKYTTTPVRAAACAGRRVTPVSVRPSPGYSAGNESADSAATVFSDDAALRTVIASLNTPAFARCYRAAITKALAATFPRNTPLQVRPVTVDAKPSARTGRVASARSVYEYTTVGYHGTGHVDVAFVAGDRFLVVVAVSKAGMRAPAALRNAVFGAIARRVAG